MLFALLLEVLATIDNFSENEGFTLALRETSNKTRKILDKKKVKLHLSNNKWDAMQNETRAEKLNSTLSQLKKFTDSGLIVTKVKMSCCYFGSFGVKELKKVINCENISCLVLSCNNIGRTGANTIGYLIRKMNNLEELDLSGNCFGNQGATNLAEGLKLCSALEILDMSCNMIHAPGIKELAEALAGCSKLECLDLARNKFGDNGSTYIAEAIKELKNLTSLNLARNNIGELGMGSIANALAILPCSMLNRLDIGCNFGCNNIGSLIHIYTTATTMDRALTTLILEYGNIRGDGIICLAGVLTQCTALTCLNLKGNDIDANGATHIAEGLAKCKGLITLDLGDNAIGPEGATSIAGVLTQCTSIANLSIQGNDIGKYGADSIAKELLKMRWSALEDLNLRNNDIGPGDGIEMIALVLVLCPRLRKLDLYYNGIGTTGAFHIAHMLPECPTLTELDLGDNAIGPDGAEKLAAVLPRCGLKILDLYYNGIGDTGAFHIADVLPQCTTLTELNLSTNDIGPDGAEMLTAVHNTIQCTTREHIELRL